ATSRHFAIRPPVRATLRRVNATISSYLHYPLLVTGDAIRNLGPLCQQGGIMIKKVVAAAAATGGLVLAAAGLAVADSGAQGAAVGSPGVVSGNVIQVPVHVPVNVCGNTISVIGLLNPAFGNSCTNK